jgi:hypothetical protein
MPRHTLLAALCLLAGCSVHDSHVALAAKSELIGTTQTVLDM